MRNRELDHRTGRFTTVDPKNRWPVTGFMSLQYLPAGGCQSCGTANAGTTIAMPGPVSNITPEPMYIYCANNPVNYIDPLGLFRWHGNWGGPGWTAGKYKSEEKLTRADLGVPSTDVRDECYKQHDICIWLAPCGTETEKMKHIRSCDRELAKCLLKISTKEDVFWMTSEGDIMDTWTEALWFATVIPVFVHR